jgi:hypothetical protein
MKIIITVKDFFKKFTKMNESCHEHRVGLADGIHHFCGPPDQRPENL